MCIQYKAHKLYQFGVKIEFVEEDFEGQDFLKSEFEVLDLLNFFCAVAGTQEALLIVEMNIMVIGHSS